MPSGRSQQRYQVALEAARLLYHRHFKEYYQAKREAAKRLGTRHLPTNREIHQQLMLLAERLDGDRYRRSLAKMRRAALELMRLLEDFAPRLIGSVWTGSIRKGSDIDLHLFAEELDDVLAVLDGASIAYEVERVHSRKHQEIMEFIHVRLENFRSFPVEMTVYPPEWLHTRPRCGITGGPMARGTIAEVQRVLQQDHPDESEAPVNAEDGSALTALSELLARPLDWDRIKAALPELRACQGVAQNHFHHLDVFEHTRAVVEGLARLLDNGFERFPQLAERLCSRLDARAGELLLLAGLLHDVGKPACQSFEGERIRFLGHAEVSARLAQGVVERLELSPEDGRRVVSLVAEHMSLMLLPADAANSELHILLRDLEKLFPELALLAIADLEAARGPAQTEFRLERQRALYVELLTDHLELGFLSRPCMPVSNWDLKEEFGLRHESERKKLLVELTELYVDGEFESREEGLSLVSELMFRR